MITRGKALLALGTPAFVGLALALCVPILLFHGLVLLKLWNWFTPPIGGAHLLYDEAVGLMLLIWFLAPDTGLGSGGRWERLGRALGNALIRPAFLLALGWLVRQWWGA